MVSSLDYDDRFVERGSGTCVCWVSRFSICSTLLVFVFVFRSESEEEELVHHTEEAELALHS